jgi:DnaJ-domain-containing protein 1
MAIDRYDTIAGNLGAVAASLYALRAVARHGSAEIMDRAFTGFAALAAPEQWFQVLGVSANASEDEIDRAYRRLASAHHPDRNDEGGDVMGRINRARDQAMEQFT